MKPILYSRYPQIWLTALSIWLMPLLAYGAAKYIFNSVDMVFSMFDWVIFALFFLSGTFIILQRKIFWFVSIALLFVIAISNLYQSSVLGSQMQNFDYQFLLSSSVLLSIGLISYYYRFPYLDSRDTGLFGLAHRFKAHMPAQLDQKYDGTVTSVSISGVLFIPAARIEGLKVGDKIKMNISDLNLHQVPVEVRGLKRGPKDEEIRLQFMWLGFNQFRNLKNRLQSLPAEDSL